MHGALRVGVAVLLVGQAGCFAYRSGPDDSRPWPPQPRPNPPSLSLAVYGRISQNGRPEPFLIGTAKFRDLCSQVYASSGLFSEVLPAGKEGDLTAELDLTLDRSFSKALAWIWELTLLVVPLIETFEFTWTTTFRDASGRILGVVEKKGSVVVVEELLLFLPAPFCTQGSAENALMEELCRSTLLDALEKGYVRP